MQAGQGLDLLLHNSQKVKSRVFVADHRTSENSEPKGSSNSARNSKRCCYFPSKGWKPSCLFYGYLGVLKEW